MSNERTAAELLRQAKSLASDNQHEGAISVFQAAYEHPDATAEQQLKALSSITIVAYNSGDYESAQKWARMTLEVDPENESAQQVLGRAETKLASRSNGQAATAQGASNANTEEVETGRPGVFRVHAVGQPELAYLDDKRSEDEQSADYTAGDHSIEKTPTQAFNTNVEGVVVLKAVDRRREPLKDSSGKEILGLIIKGDESRRPKGGFKLGKPVAMPAA